MQNGILEDFGKIYFPPRDIIYLYFYIKISLSKQVLETTLLLLKFYQTLIFTGEQHVGINK